MAVAFLIPGWLTSEGYVTLATWGLVFATLVLGFATFLLFLDGRAKSKEQRQRWEREDAFRESEATPKAEFGLQGAPNKVNLWCANLGTSSFLVSSVRITTACFPDTKIIPLEPLIVPVGKIATTEILPEHLNPLRNNCEVGIEIQGPSKRIVLTARPYSILVSGDRILEVNPFFRNSEILTCAKCEQMVALFQIEGLSSLEEFEKNRVRVESEFEESCPQHLSKSTRVRRPKYGSDPVVLSNSLT